MSISKCPECEHTGKILEGKCREVVRDAGGSLVYCKCSCPPSPQLAGAPEPRCFLVEHPIPHGGTWMEVFTHEENARGYARDREAELHVKATVTPLYVRADLSTRGVEGDSDLFKNACRIYTSWIIGRYLIVNTEGREDGAEKAERHHDLCSFYLGAIHGCDPDHAGRDYPEDYDMLHEASQELTSRLDEAIGFPIKGMPDYKELEPKFFEAFHAIAMSVLKPAPPVEREGGVEGEALKFVRDYVKEGCHHSCGGEDCSYAGQQRMKRAREILRGKQ